MPVRPARNDGSMMSAAVEGVIVLASRSPQRRELLQLLFSGERLRILAPSTPSEAEFDDVSELPAIHQRLRDIARDKCDDVLSQLSTGDAGGDRDRIAAVIAADTTIIATDAAGYPQVLGQPPAEPEYAETLRFWFRDLYAGRAHCAATAVCIANLHGKRVERLVESQVTFREDAAAWIDWYLATGEPRGKAGGYAIQGLGSVFVQELQGSLSNVVGLPLEAVLEMLEELVQCDG